MNTTVTPAPVTLGPAAIGSVEPAKRLRQHHITKVQVVAFSKELQAADSAGLAVQLSEWAAQGDLLSQLFALLCKAATLMPTIYVHIDLIK